MADESENGANVVPQVALATRLAAAREALALAESGLEIAMREIGIAPRAEKRTIGPRLEEAFERMREARREIASLEALLSVSDDVVAGWVPVAAKPTAAGE